MSRERAAGLPAFRAAVEAHFLFLRPLPLLSESEEESSCGRKTRIAQRRALCGRQASNSRQLVAARTPSESDELSHMPFSFERALANDFSQSFSSHGYLPLAPICAHTT